MSLIARRVNLASGVSGVLPVANGGWGSSNGSFTSPGGITFNAALNGNITFTGSGTSAFVANTLAGSFSNLTLSAAGNVTWSGRGIIQCTAGGVFEARNSGFSALIPFDTLYNRQGSGTPEAAVAAPIGAIFHRSDGTTNTSAYIKQSGTGNTGWAAVTP